MKESHWAVYALRDIQNALSREKYMDASSHIDDAIRAIQMPVRGERLCDACKERMTRQQS